MRQIEEAVVRPTPIDLTDAKLDVGHHPVTEADAPIAVHAYVRFHEAVIRPDCEAIAWTDRAVKIRWTMHNGTPRAVWVWASGVERRGRP